MHKIDLSHNRIKISKLLTIQVVMMLFAILFTYKWAVNYVDIIEQRFDKCHLWNTWFYWSINYSRINT